MRKSLLLALAGALAMPAALPAQESDPRIIPTDWTLAKPAARNDQARPDRAVRRPRAAPRKPGARIHGGATMTNRSVGGRKKAKVGVAVPF